MTVAAAVRLLESGDVRAYRAAFTKVFPHLPPLASDRAAEQSMHYARTMNQHVSLDKRAYSHRWLVERNLPSALPDRLKPKAERMYPKIVTAVGIACGGKSELSRAVAPIVQRAMENAVLEAEADGKLLDSAHVKQRMDEARERTTQQLLGCLLTP